MSPSNALGFTSSSSAISVLTQRFFLLRSDTFCTFCTKSLSQRVFSWKFFCVGNRDGFCPLIYEIATPNSCKFKQNIEILMGSLDFCQIWSHRGKRCLFILRTIRDAPPSTSKVSAFCCTKKNISYLEHIYIWMFLKIHFYMVFHYKPSILGTPIFGNTHISVRETLGFFFHQCEVTKKPSLC